MTTAAAPATHPLFDRYPDHQWTGDLPGLFKRLLKEAPDTNGSAFAWRVLPRGAVVGVRIHPQHLRPELKIARSEAPTTPDGWARWEHEVGTFLKQFGITPVLNGEPAPDDKGWMPLPPPAEDEGKAAARFLQLRKGETSPGKARCHPCHEAGVARPIEWFPGGGVTGQNCMGHAFQTGREYAERVLARTRTT